MGFLGRFFRRKYLLGFGLILAERLKLLNDILPELYPNLRESLLAGIGSSPSTPREHPT